MVRLRDSNNGRKLLVLKGYCGYAKKVTPEALENKLARTHLVAVRVVPTIQIPHLVEYLLKGIRFFINDLIRGKVAPNETAGGTASLPMDVAAYKPVTRPVVTVDGGLYM
jgi:hypothetical protein